MPNSRGLSLLVIGIVLGAAAPGVASETATRRVRAHTEYLADDLLEGRAAGTRGYDLAARYVASQFARLGIAPGADDGSYLQPVRLREAATKLEAGRFAVRTAAGEDTLAPINDVLVAPAPTGTAAAVTAPAVFVGFGVRAPELGYDDYAGVDLRGKIAVMLGGAPSRFPSTQRAHHSSGEQKRRLAIEHGAVGVVTITHPRDETRAPWAMAVAQSRFPGMRLLDAAGGIVDGYPELRVRASVRTGAAERLFVASGRTVEDVFAQAERGEPQAFPLNAEFALAGESSHRAVESANVLGWLPGADPALAGEPIVVTAHLDHLGIGAAVGGDSIYNGAHDNAIGIAVLLAAAEVLASGPPPARPVLFAALTAEEKGLLGAEQLARQPPARVRRHAANVNLDMALFISPVRDLILWGAEHTTLGATATAVAAKAGFSVSPDPMPEETIFVRSDQYAFVRTGVPSLYVSSGQRALDGSVDLAAEWTNFLRQRYHKPNDDLAQPIDWPSAGAFADVMADLLRAIADDPQPPRWLPGDFFGELFGTKSGQ